MMILEIVNREKQTGRPTVLPQWDASTEFVGRKRGR